MNWKKPKKYFSSELIITAMQEANIDLLYPVNRITPDKLMTAPLIKSKSANFTIGAAIGAVVGSVFWASYWAARNLFANF